MAQRRLDLARVVAVGVFSAVLVSCASTPTPSARESSWEHQMQVAVEAAHQGDRAEARAAFERARELAFRERPDRIAYTRWHYGDMCFKRPDWCAPGEAERATEQAYEIFAVEYGPEHPVVIPVLLRLSEIRAAQGDAEAAGVLLGRADQITARTFPESHFMRSQIGAHRPASDLHPQELLRILAELDLLDG